MSSRQMESYSLADSNNYPIDWKLLQVLLPIAPNGGFFVEVGANDGVTQSNTLLLDSRFGWSGLLVEPCVQAFNKCKTIRSKNPNNVIIHGALVGSNDVKTIEGDFTASDNGVDYGSLMNSVGGTRRGQESRPMISVPAFTLSSLHQQYKLPNIDFMSLDVEGYEAEVLKGIDLSADWSPKVFLIELYNHEKQTVFNLLDPHYHNVGNFTNHTKPHDPTWIEHNDYLFIKKSYVASAQKTQS